MESILSLTLKEFIIWMAALQAVSCLVLVWAVLQIVKIKKTAIFGKR